MITMPEDVLQADEGTVGFSWDGESPHPVLAGETVPNKETTMDWAEHQRIVFNAGKLLASWTADKHKGKSTKDAYKALKDAYDGSNKDRSVLRVSKGIHQPWNNPHLQVRVVATFYNAEKDTSMSHNYTFHLNVSAKEIKDVNGLDDSFQWEGVQFSYLDEGNWSSWPFLAVASGKNTTTRRSSISYASLTEHKNELAEQEKERLRLEKIEQAKQQAASLEVSINLELARLKQEEGLELRRKGNEPNPKFFKGTAKAFVVDKYGKKGYYVIWDPPTKKLVRRDW